MLPAASGPLDATAASPRVIPPISPGDKNLPADLASSESKPFKNSPPPVMIPDAAADTGLNFLPKAAFVAALIRLADIPLPKALVPKAPKIPLPAK